MKGYNAVPVQRLRPFSFVLAISFCLKSVSFFVSGFLASYYLFLDLTLLNSNRTTHLSRVLAFLNWLNLFPVPLASE